MDILTLKDALPKDASDDERRIAAAILYDSFSDGEYATERLVAYIMRLDRMGLILEPRA